MAAPTPHIFSHDAEKSVSFACLPANLSLQIFMLGKGGGA